MSLTVTDLFAGAGGSSTGMVAVPGVQVKICRICKESKPLSAFSRRPNSADGHRNDCKRCVVVRTSGRDRRVYLRQYAQAHPEKHRGRKRPGGAEYFRRYRAENPERIRAIVARSTAKHRADRVARQHERRSHPMDDVARQYVAILLEGPCAYCPAPALTIDHIVPLSRGGTNDWWNLTGACKSCNSSKGTRSLLEYLMGAVVESLGGAA